MSDLSLADSVPAASMLPPTPDSAAGTNVQHDIGPGAQRAATSCAQTPAAEAGSPIESYADLAFSLPLPHGPDCPCLACADGRKAMGHRPLVPQLFRRGWGAVTPQPIPVRADDVRGMSDDHRYKIGANRLKIDVSEYRAHIEAGESWCSHHRRWELRSEFPLTTTRRRGIGTICKAAAREQYRERKAS